jgi:uncharacterized surface protein with fasciclin (FAS1) repeats
MKMKSSLLTLFSFVSLTVGFAQKTVVDIAVNSPNHSTLVTALKSADLVETLQGAGPFTIFAPTNDAFNKLPVGTLDKLLNPESKAELVKILTYHVVAGNFNADAVVKAINAGKGTTRLTTLSGVRLTLSLKNGKVVLTDEQGGTSTVVVKDLKADNGIVHVIDNVLLLK